MLLFLMVWVSHQVTPWIIHCRVTFCIFSAIFQPVFYIFHALHHIELDFQHLPCILYIYMAFCMTNMTFTQVTWHGRLAVLRCTTLCTTLTLLIHSTCFHTPSTCVPHSYSEHTIPHICSLLLFIYFFASHLNTLGPSSVILHILTFCCFMFIYPELSELF